MLPFRVILVFVLIFMSGQIIGQTELTRVYDSIISSELAIAEKVKKVEDLFRKNQNNSIDLAEVYYNFSKWNWIRANDERRAKLYAKKEYAIRRSNDTTRNDLIQRNLYNLGYLHHHSSYPDYDNAIAYFDTLISVSKGDELRLANVYRERGDIYDALGDFQRAFENYSYSENISKNSNRPDLQLKALINVSGTIVNLSDSTYLGAFTDNLKKVETLEGVQISERQHALLKFNTGAMFNSTPQIDRAYGPTSEALNYFKSVNDSVNIVKSLNLLGVLYTKDNDFANATEVLKEAQEFAVGNRLLESSVANNMGDVYRNAGDLDMALKYYHLAVIGTLGKSASDPGLELPEFEELSISPFKKLVFGYLNDLAGCWVAYYERSNDEIHLKNAEKTIALADKVIDALFLESREEVSKLSWREKASNLYLQGVAVAHKLGKPGDALYYIEKNKGLLLLENINNVKARQNARIPSVLVDREYQLLSNIKQLQFLLAGESAEEKLDYLDSLKGRVFELKSDYRKFIDSLETSYPSYVKFKKQLEIDSMEEIQLNLAENQRVISYALGDSLGYALLLTKGSIELKELPVSVNRLNTEVAKLRSYLEKPFGTKQESEEFQKLANSLFKALFPFDDFGIGLTDSNLVIIPDGVLQTIPFGVLTISSEASLSEAYLITKCEVSYKYSLSVGSGIDRLLPTEEDISAGFLLSEFNDNYENTLSNGTKEFEMITPFYEGRIFTDHTATKTEFLKQFDMSSVIHLSTHGGVGDDGPWLAFYDERLRLEELYFLKNQKELVVLSACKTSVGEHRKGEGVFSITRGFLNAGVKSVLSTLWDINEKSSFEVVSGFYENLEAGQRKSEALRGAKLAYLLSHENTSEASPYYWSGITITGDDTPLKPDSFFSTFLIGFIVLGLLVMGYLFFRKRI